MPSRKPAPAPPTRRRVPPPPDEQLQSALGWLKRHGTKRTRDGMSRYGLPSTNAFGVTVAGIKTLAQRLGRDHQLAAGLWDSGWYEARMLASFVDVPASVTPAQMERWCRDFDNWGICDTVCFHLFDRTPYAWQKVAEWHDRPEEFVKRGAFALLWGLTVHDKQAADERFSESLLQLEQAAADERHLVKKAVNMALRAIGKRNSALNVAAVRVARRLAGSPHVAACWVGKDALRELTGAAVTRRLASRDRAAARAAV
jgi:3-methyladenine DNA glycosylase AlkD